MARCQKIFCRKFAAESLKREHIWGGEACRIGCTALPPERASPASFDPGGGGGCAGGPGASQEMPALTPAALSAIWEQLGSLEETVQKKPLKSLIFHRTISHEDVCLQLRKHVVYLTTDQQHGFFCRHVCTDSHSCLFDTGGGVGG